MRSVWRPTVFTIVSPTAIVRSVRVAGLGSRRLVSELNDRFGAPQSNGSVDTPATPAMPATFWLKANRLVVSACCRLKSTRIDCSSPAFVKEYVTGTSHALDVVDPPSDGKLLALVASECR